MKTHKTIAKRIRITKRGKLIKLHGGQNHFNGRDPGKITRKKRRDQQVNAVYVRALKTLIAS